MECHYKYRKKKRPTYLFLKFAKWLGYSSSCVWFSQQLLLYIMTWVIHSIYTHPYADEEMETLELNKEIIFWRICLCVVSFLDALFLIYVIYFRRKYSPMNANTANAAIAQIVVCVVSFNVLSLCFWKQSILLHYLFVFVLTGLEIRFAFMILQITEREIQSSLTRPDAILPFRP